MKRLEDMNLVDDFLAYSLTVHKIYGEKASRYILECILQRKIKHLTIVPQKIWYGEEPENHGVRLDVYLEYSCAMKSHFRKSGNQMSGKWKSSYASLLA